MLTNTMNRVRFTSGDMFAHRHAVRVIPVNCVGVMGKGIAKTFAMSNRAIEQEYRLDCIKERIRPGVVREYQAHGTWGGYIAVLLPTKLHWRNPSLIGYVQDGLHALKDWANESDWPDGSTLALPRVGCGLGGLHWMRDVRPLVLNILGRIETIDVVVYE